MTDQMKDDDVMRHFLYGLFLAEQRWMKKPLSTS